jgi:hypothetical protein
MTWNDTIQAMLKEERHTKVIRFENAKCQKCCIVAPYMVRVGPMILCTNCFNENFSDEARKTLRISSSKDLKSYKEFMKEWSKL